MRDGRKSPATTAMIALVLVVGALLAKRDHDEGQRLDALAREIATLRADIDARDQVSRPGSDTIDARGVDAIATRVAAAVALRPAPATVAAPTAGTPAAQPATDRPEASPDQVLAAKRAGAVVDDAIRRGRFTRGDAQDLDRELAQSAPEEAQEIARRLAVAVNTNQLSLENPRAVPARPNGP